uniref:BRO1 domain-containing protein n=1 Tax=Rhabditophanes sp. KR3021 TaxID=114890 RepID=A0AC35UFQ8_9BILA
MTHWFHRHPLKPSLFIKFDGLQDVLTTDSASKLCGELRLRRDQFLEKLRNASNNCGEVENDFDKYMKCMYGFVVEPTDETKKKDSKLRHLVKFTWGHTMLGTEAFSVADAWFEILSMCVNMALYLMKHSAYLSQKEDMNEEECKIIFKSLRKAAGLFEYAQSYTEKVNGTTGTDIPYCDLDNNILEVYKQQCLGEAQEIVMGKAIEDKHKAELIANLSYSTAKVFANCSALIEKLPKNIFGKWNHYFKIKEEIYTIYAYAFLAEKCLAEDKCGVAIACCKVAITHYDNAADLCDKYPIASGVGIIAKIKNHLFFRKMVPILKRHLEKAERENGFIYHQPVPAKDQIPSFADSSPLAAKAEPYELPLDSEIWNDASYKSFDITKAKMPDFAKIKKSSKKLKVVDEVTLYSTEKDRNNKSGCTIS